MPLQWSWIWRIAALVSLLLAAAAQPATGQIEGITLISQATAVAGGVTPGDAPGFPVTISRAGSYRLATNLTVSDPTKRAIHITADYVTLDLNGFAIEGPYWQCFNRLVPIWCSQILQPGHGIYSLARYTTLLRGTVRYMTFNGLNLGPAARIERLVVSSNRIHGIALLDLVQGGIISDSTLERNGHYGLVCNNCLAFRNTIQFNGGAGIAGVAGNPVLYGFNILNFNNNGQDQINAQGYESGRNLCRPACP